MKLTTLSPVFIGGGERLSNLDYFYNLETSELKIIDEKKFFKFLIKNELLDSFINFVSKIKNAKLYEWAKIQNLNLDNYEVFKSVYNYSKTDIKALNDVNLFVKNVFGQAFIPASSIKGVIHTAVLQKKLNDTPDIKCKYKELIEDALKSRNICKLNKIEKAIEKDLLCIDVSSEITTKFLNVFNGIQVSDSKIIEKKNLDLYKKMDYSFADEKIHQVPLYRECIKPYVETEFDITLDLNIVKELKINIEYILEALDEYSVNWHKAISCFEEYIDNFNLYLPKENERYRANFCIGGGSGFLTKTVVCSILDEKTARDSIKTFLDLVFQRRKKPLHRHVEKDVQISPRTLKLARENNDYLNLGWCNISLI